MLSLEESKRRAEAIMALHDRLPPRTRRAIAEATNLMRTEDVMPMVGRISDSLIACFVRSCDEHISQQLESLR